MLTYLQDIAKLFQELEWRQGFRLQHALTNPRSSPFRMERSPTVFSRNRYNNVQPWDQSRIRLKTPIDGSDYVNASPICLTSRCTPSPPNAKSDASIGQKSTTTRVDLPKSKYIATQGPKDGQFSHFWNMVMQETVGDVGVVVMLTQCWEGSKEKCAQYFPASMDMPILDLEPNERSNQPLDVAGDPFLDLDPLSDEANSDSVEEQSSDRNTPEAPEDVNRKGSVTLLDFYYDTNSKSEARKLKLQIGKEIKTIWHYLFKGWPDYGKPEGEDRRALLELIKQSAVKAGDPGLNPRFVHCSAGVGRTGTFIALDYLLWELARGKLEVITPSSASPNSPESSDVESPNGSLLTGKESTPEVKEDLIFETVNSLREQRMMMVMNDVQFSFLYEVLREAYVEMYSPKHIKAVGTGAGEIRDDNSEVSGEGTGTHTQENGEPSPKMARTGNMLFVGPSQEEGKMETDRKSVNNDAVTANSTVLQAVGQEEDPYAVVDPEVVRQEKEAKND